jgi:hypothetical protein
MASATPEMRSRSGQRSHRSVHVAHRESLLAFALALAMAVVIADAQGPKLFYYDSRQYWILSAAFKQDGGFSLLNFADPVRGYLFPLSNLALRDIAGSVGWQDATIVKALNALCFALIGAVLAPKLAELVWPQRRWSLWRRLAMAAVLLVFWRGYLDFPLTDFPALTLVLVALIASERLDSAAWMMGAGLALGGAINMRPAYLPALVAIAVLVALAWREDHYGSLSNGRRTLHTMLLVVGVLVVSVPQSLSAHRHHDIWSPLPGAPANLSGMQFTYSLQMQRYDTYVGNDGLPAALTYRDPLGSRLLEEEGGSVTGASHYVELIVTHPVTMARIFVRHIINGLDQRYPTPYIDTFDADANRIVRGVGFVLLFLALTRLAWRTARRTLGPCRWRYLVALLLMAAPAVASGVEARFMLPAFIAISIVVLAPGWRQLELPPSPIRRTTVLLVLLAVYSVAMAVVVHITDEAAKGLPKPAFDEARIGSLSDTDPPEPRARQVSWCTLRSKQATVGTQVTISMSKPVPAPTVTVLRKLDAMKSDNSFADSRAARSRSTARMRLVSNPAHRQALQR